MDVKSKVLSSLFWKLFEKGGRAVIELVVQIVLARLLAPNDFGLLAIILVFVNVGNVIVQSGLNTSLVQMPHVDDDDFSTVFWMCLLVSLVLYVGIFLLAPVLSAFYRTDALVWPLRVISIVLIVNAFNSVQIAYIQRTLDFKKIFRSTIASIMVSGTMGISLAVAGAGLWALVMQQICFQAVTCIMLSFQVRWRPRCVFRRDRALMHFRFGWKLLASGLLDTCYQSLSDLIIGKQFDSIQLGLVSQGKKYPQALGGMLDGAIQPVMMSAVSRVQSDAGYVKRLVRRALKTSTYLIVPAMALFALVADPFVRTLLGEQWLPCVPFVQMYCFVYALLPIHTTNLQALNGMGRSDLFLKLEIVKKIYGIAILCFTAFALQDVFCIVAGYMVGGIIGTFVNSYPNKHVIGYTYFEQVRDVSPAFLLSAAAVAAAWPISQLALPAVATIAAQSSIVVTVYLALSKLFHVEELSYLASTARELIASKKGM
ncbi:lipopolysaccharide biosynthesis protein [Eggerthella guodeyinii]|uniref:Oligosaccharide flippase family protein n=1 Tax=Eggerthella guodeyinii TaxID=2690837 RepID=A0A6N7RNP2_9ACTN|nr:lipopolysaccharide biosynthesis protein [Eggerthella guodeyinii]MRX82338.1 oligosaccharide flippase family protein [Eggerthella guodeyinii]